MHAFEVLYRPSWTQRVFDQVLAEASEIQRTRAALQDPAPWPLVVLPYLNAEKLDRLLQAGVSGLDLNGNALITVDDAWLLRFSGRRNRYTSDVPLCDRYSGKSALVGCTLLRQPVYRTARALHADILRRGGNLSTALISRVLAALSEDVIVGARPGDKMVLLQPERLLDRLARPWLDRHAKVLWRGRVDETTAAFLPRLFDNARRAGVEAGMTGLGSASRHTHLTLETTAYLYADEAGPLLKGLRAMPGDRFANLEVWARLEAGVIYDAVPDAQGVRWAPERQTYLELQAGDARLQDGAVGLRAAILRRVQDWSPA